METLYSPWEAILYAFVDTVPYMALMLYDFRDRWRFSRRVTLLLAALSAAGLMAIISLNLLHATPMRAVLDMSLGVLYVLFTLLVIRDNVGKLLFALLVLTNLGNLIVVCSKYVESLLFPELALLRYHYTYSLVILPMQIILLPLVYWLIFWHIQPSDAEGGSLLRKQAAMPWRYLWMVPGVFYLIWTRHFYFSSKSSLEMAMDPLSAVYIFLVDMGSVLIYRLIVRLVMTYRDNLVLQAANQALILQQMQYESLNKRIEESQRARHDLRHHMALLRNIYETRDLDALKAYIDRNSHVLHPEEQMVYCANSTVNTLLFYFAAQARERGVDYSVQVNLPEEVAVEKTDLAVVVGNLIENAMEACAKGDSAKAFVRIRGGLSGRNLMLIVENSCFEEPRTHSSGKFYSSKRAGYGIGTESVRDIAAHYNGYCLFKCEKGVFQARVMLNS